MDMNDIEKMSEEEKRQFALKHMRSRGWSEENIAIILTDKGATRVAIKDAILHKNRPIDERIGELALVTMATTL